MTYEDAVGFIGGFTKSGAPQKDLSRFRRLCARLGNPQEKLRFLHVAGTNGKGSVCAYLDEALRASGLRTGCFTSPYITDLRERIRLNGENISKTDFSRCIEQIQAVSDRRTDFSQFELFTAAAFLFYAEAGADVVVLETGIGGLYDCTNIVTPLLSVITRIDYDHCALLGRTIPEITAHKAGIIKPGVPAFSSPNQTPEALAVLKEQAKKCGAPLTEADGAALCVTENSLHGTRFLYRGKQFSTKMGGLHQPENAAAAIEALRCLKIPEQAVSAGLQNAALPARMQVYSEDPLLIIDGGHNESGARAAQRLLEAEKLRPVMVLGMLETKEWEKALPILLKQASSVIFTDGFHPQAVPAEKLLGLARKLGIPAQAIREPKKALAMAGSSGDPVFAGGSLYLAGEILKSLSERDESELL